MNLALPAETLAVAAVAASVAYGAMAPRSQLFGPTVYATDSPKKLAITFDDGPNPAMTPQLLELLRRYNARATFFVIGKYARECPELLKEIAARGHVVGNHTNTHPNLFWRGPKKIREETRICSESIASILGTPPKWFRPPFGVRNPWVGAAARELGLHVAMWTLLPGDWRASSVDWLAQRMRPIETHLETVQPHGLRSGDILCLHDGYHAKQNGDRRLTFEALQYWLPRWRDLGLEFVTIDEAVRIPA